MTTKICENNLHSAPKNSPISEECEKTINVMEVESSLNRAALRHTNEMYNEKEEVFQLSRRGTGYLRCASRS